MSDVLKTNELIVAKLREVAKQAEWYQALDTKLLTAAADALEAATRDPSEDDREVLIDVVKRNRSVVKRMGDGYPSVAFVTDETIADAILAVGFSRATVPDAAPEDDREALRKEFEFRIRTAIAHGCAIGYRELSAQDREEWVRGQVDRAVGSRTAVPGATTSAADENLFFAKQTFDEITEERDAALAALERVRAIHQKRGASWPHNGGVYVCGADNGIWPCPTIAALDGAPEPETPELFPGANSALDRLAVRKPADTNAFCIEHGITHSIELGDPTCEFEDGFGEPVGGESNDA